MKTNRIFPASQDTAMELTRLDRIVLHLRCLCHDHKYRWHWAGIWRELRAQ